MNPNYAPHDYSKAPSPNVKPHLAPWTHANLMADFIGDRPASTGRRARR